MLKGISPAISPDLIKVLMEMGHGDELVIADGNFPSASIAQRLVRADGLGCLTLLVAIPRIFPLDQYVEKPVALMAVVPGDPYQPVIWEDYHKIVQQHESGFKEFDYVERFAFYERAKKAYVVLATSEMALYTNIILKKGAIKGQCERRCRLSSIMSICRNPQGRWLHQTSILFRLKTA
jgi:L-fucose mutarotase